MMLYDEPTVGLDPITADSVCSLINQLSKGEPPSRTGLIIVTHNLRDAAKVAERFIFLREQILFDGDINALVAARESEIEQFVAESFLSPAAWNPSRHS